MPWSRARKKSVPTEAANTITLSYRLLEVHERRVDPAGLLRVEADERRVGRAADHLEGAVLLHLHDGEAVGSVAVGVAVGRRRRLVLAGPVDRGEQAAGGVAVHLAAVAGLDDLGL